MSLMISKFIITPETRHSIETAERQNSAAGADPPPTPTCTTERQRAAVPPVRWSELLERGPMMALSRATEDVDDPAHCRKGCSGPALRFLPPVRSCMG